MKESKLSQLKTWVPLLTLSVAAPALASPSDVDCKNIFAGTEITFWQPRSSDQSFLTIRHLGVDGIDYWSGSGFLRGEGAINPKNFDVDVLFSATGSTEDYLLGKLVGKKTGPSWSLVFVSAKTNEETKLSCTPKF